MIEAAVAASDALPVQAGLLTALVGLCGLLVRFLLQDRGAGFDLADGLRVENTQLRDQNELLRREISEQRTMKHDYINKYAVAVGTLDVVRRLAPNCSCGALDAVSDLLDRREEER